VEKYRDMWAGQIRKTLYYKEKLSLIGIQRVMKFWHRVPIPNFIYSKLLCLFSEMIQLNSKF